MHVQYTCSTGMIKIDFQRKSYTDLNMSPAGPAHQMILIYLHFNISQICAHPRKYKKRSPISAVFSKQNKIPFNQPDIETLRAALTALTLVNLLITPVVVLMLMQLS